MTSPKHFHPLGYLSLILALSACSRAQPPKGAAHAGEPAGHDAACTEDHTADAASSTADPHAGHDHGAEAPAGAVELSDSAIENLGIKFAKCEKRAVSRTLRIPGAFEVSPGTRRAVSARIAGQVTPKVRAQDRVVAGQVVAELSSPLWQEWHTKLSEAKAQLKLAQATRCEAQAKLKTLEKHQAELAAIGSSHAEFKLEADMLRISLPTRDTEVEAAQGRITALEAQMEPWGGSDAKNPVILAPVAGVVESVPVVPGAWAEPADTLLTLQGIPRFAAAVPQAALAKIEEGLPSRVSAPEGFSGKDFSGTLRLASAQDAGTRALPVFLESPDVPVWARIGQAGWLEITLPGSAPAALAIPESALVKDGMEFVFFVKDKKDPDRVLRVVAERGASDGAFVEIKKGIAEGDEVVIRGAYAVGLAAASSSTAKAPPGYHFCGGTLHKNEEEGK